MASLGTKIEACHESCDLLIVCVWGDAVDVKEDILYMLKVSFVDRGVLARGLGAGEIHEIQNAPELSTTLQGKAVHLCIHHLGGGEDL